MGGNRGVRISKRTWRITRALAISAIILAAILLIVLIVVIVEQTFLPSCSIGKGIKPRNFEKPGVFDDLTPVEMNSVRDYLLKLDSPSLVRQEEASVNSSYIFLIDLHMTLKSAVLQYLDGGHRQPDRTAKAVVYRGDTDPPRVEEYLVGPLPRANYHILIANPAYRRLPIPWESRPVDSVEYKILYAILYKATKRLYPIFRESFGLHHHNCTASEICMTFCDSAPRGIKSGERKTWFSSYRNVEGYYNHPLGFEIQIGHEGNEITTWDVTRLVYNGQMYYSVDKFIEQYFLGRVRKISHKIDPYDLKYSSYERRGPRDYDTPGRGPRFYEPDGRRYSVDGQHVKYVGWNFNFRMRTTTGLQIYDVRFQGERLAYELSLQETSSLYSGYGVVSGFSNYFDVSGIAGATSYELVPGVDCPGTASFHDAYHYVDSGQPRLNRNSICIFEVNSGMPLRRHYSTLKGEFSGYGGLVDHHLVVRNILTRSNNDYIVDYIFHLNGIIKIKISTSGYVQSTYNIAHEKPYGYLIEDNVLANLHQHLFHIKADLDIGGRDNRYSTLDLSTETVRVPWYVDMNKTQVKFKSHLKEKEMDGVLEYSFDHPKYHLIYNHNSRNKFGSHRAYRIQNDAMSKFMLHNTKFGRAAGWARYQMAVTKHQDMEDVSSSIYAQNDPFDPVLDFHRFLENNDDLVDEDLVLWLTTGSYHIPHSEDTPSVSTSANQYTVVLSPYNFFPTCPTVSFSETLHMKPNKNHDSVDVQTFGTEVESKCFQKEMTYDVFNGSIPLV